MVVMQAHDPLTCQQLHIFDCCPAVLNVAAGHYLEQLAYYTEDIRLPPP